MHTIQTFVLRLFIDLDSLKVLRGSLQIPTEEEVHPFSSEKMCGVLLRQMISEIVQKRRNLLEEEDHG
jgi:hypothetical protein